MQKNIKLEDITKNKDFINFFCIINPISIVLYGSYATNKATINSDIDLMIFVKPNQINKEDFDDKVIEIKYNIKRYFNKNIDLVIMGTTNKIKYDNFDDSLDCNSIFLSNVLQEGINVYGKDFRIFIQQSQIYKKF